MSTLIKDGSHVIEMFASSFEDFIKTHASEYIEFIDALDAELKSNDIAIVIATDYRYDGDETTIFVVYNDR